MGDLSEVETFDCLKSNLRQAAQSCDDLAVKPRKGPTFRDLRDQLRLVEGACRQVAYFRNGDARWLQIGMFVAEAHKRAGEWLRGVKGPDGVRVKTAPGHMNPLFVKLAENLRALYAKSEDLETKKTNRTGPILPVVRRGPHRDTVPVGYTKSIGGVLIPAH
jgi:hypothetical protein